MPVVTEGTEIGILTPKQILQRLPVQVKVGKTSENVLNEIS